MAQKQPNPKPTEKRPEPSPAPPRKESGVKFKDVESLCGIARLALMQAIVEAGQIEDEEFRNDAAETIAGTVNEFVEIFKGAEHEQNKV